MVSGAESTLEYVEVTTEDREYFQNWLKKTTRRYEADHELRDRGQKKIPFCPSSRPIVHRKRPIDLDIRASRTPHERHGAPLTTGATLIGKDLYESLPLALAALVVGKKAEDDPITYLLPWVGENGDMLAAVIDVLESPPDSLRELVVVGLRCEKEGCRRFIRPVAGRPSAPDDFLTSAVCAVCKDVTVVWPDDGRIWVTCAPELNHYPTPLPRPDDRDAADEEREAKKHPRYHPMRAYELSAWVQSEQPATDCPACLIIG